MKFIVDAQLPYGIVLFLRRQGHDVIHTDDLPEKERTTDSEIRRIAQTEDRIVISKDKDFVDSHLLQQQPARLLWIRTGNIVNRALFNLLERNWPAIEERLQQAEIRLLIVDNESLTDY